jgi:hypothetical protein
VRGFVLDVNEEEQRHALCAAIAEEYIDIGSYFEEKEVKKVFQRGN